MFYNTKEVLINKVAISHFLYTICFIFEKHLVDIVLIKTGKNSSWFSNLRIDMGLESIKYLIFHPEKQNLHPSLFNVNMHIKH